MERRWPAKKNWPRWDLIKRLIFHVGTLWGFPKATESTEWTCLIFVLEAGRSALCKWCKLISWQQQRTAVAGGMYLRGLKVGLKLCKQTDTLRRLPKLRWISEEKQYKIWDSRCIPQTLTWHPSSSRHHAGLFKCKHSNSRFLCLSCSFKLN